MDPIDINLYVITSFGGETPEGVTPPESDEE
jgi:hypothetical protein